MEMLVHLSEFQAEPLIVEANGDNIADIFSLDENGNRSFWLFGSDRRVSPTMTDPLGKKSITSLTNKKCVL